VILVPREHHRSLHVRIRRRDIRQDISQVLFARVRACVFVPSSVFIPVYHYILNRMSFQIHRDRIQASSVSTLVRGRRRGRREDESANEDALRTGGADENGQNARRGELHRRRRDARCDEGIMPSHHLVRLQVECMTLYGQTVYLGRKRSAQSVILQGTKPTKRWLTMA
jgi:hypothetical protein